MDWFNTAQFIIRDWGDHSIEPVNPKQFSWDITYSDDIYFFNVNKKKGGWWTMFGLYVML